MNKQQKAEWIKALRSGDYKQCKGLLHDDDFDTYCCLGVAQSLFDLPQESIIDEYLRSDFLHKPYQIELAIMNDAGWSFTEIADYIEKHIPTTE